MTNTPLHGTDLTLLLEIMHCACNLQISQLSRASDISRGRGPAKFRHFREIPRNSPKNAKYREIRQNISKYLSAKHI